MQKPDLPAAVLQLVWNELRSIDHVAVLLAVRAAGVAHADDVAIPAMLSTEVATEILEELAKRGVLTREGRGYRLTSNETLENAVEELAESYNRKPVTLIRAIYDRPPHVIQQFADAFRLRRDEDRT
jgi:predicted transcriptional regulator